MIYLVRHGQTEWNRERRMQGRKESRLTPLGRAQAAAMGERLAELLADEPDAAWRLVSSPLGRARETAEIIGARVGLKIELDERLTEIAFGEWEGLIRDAVAPKHPELFASREWLVSAPGGETFEDVWTRITHWLAEQAPEPERRLIVVSHGMAGRVVRGAYAGLTREQTLLQDVPQDAVFRLSGGLVERFDCPEVAA